MTLKLDEAARRCGEDDRPSAKMQLPFQIFPGHRNGMPIEIIRYYGPARDGQQLPYEMEILDPENRLLDQLINPLARYVKQTCQAFWHVEAKVDGLIAERDKLLLEQIEVKGENERLKSKVAELERQKANAKQKSSNGAA